MFHNKYPAKSKWEIPFGVENSAAFDDDDATIARTGTKPQTSAQARFNELTDFSEHKWIVLIIHNEASRILGSHLTLSVKLLPQTMK